MGEWTLRGDLPIATRFRLKLCIWSDVFGTSPLLHDLQIETSPNQVAKKLQEWIHVTQVMHPFGRCIESNSNPVELKPALIESISSFITVGRRDGSRLRQDALIRETDTPARP